MPDFTPLQRSAPASGGASINLTLPSTPVVGNMVVVICGGGNSGGAMTFAATDNQAGAGNAYTLAVQSASQGNVTTAILYSVITLAAGTFTVTVTGGTSNWGIIVEIPWFGAVPLIVTASNTGFLQPTAWTGNTGVTADPDCFVAASVSLANITANPTVEAGYTEEYDYGQFKGEGDSKAVIGAAGVQSCTWGVTAGTGWACSIAAFQDTGLTSTVRDTQVVQTILSQQPSSTLRQTQVVQGVMAQNMPVVRVTQVVHTTLVLRTPEVAAVEDDTAEVLPPSTEPNAPLWKLKGLTLAYQVLPGLRRGDDE